MRHIVSSGVEDHCMYSIEEVAELTGFACDTRTALGALQLRYLFSARLTKTSLKKFMA